MRAGGDRQSVPRPQSTGRRWDSEKIATATAIAIAIATAIAIAIAIATAIAIARGTRSRG